jgi:hypothetical protein
MWKLMTTVAISLGNDVSQGNKQDGAARWSAINSYRGKGIERVNSKHSEPVLN